MRRHRPTLDRRRRGRRSSLTSASAGRSQSHIKLSEDPKVPVRSVNSSIVPAPPPPLTQRAKCNEAPPPVVRGPPPPTGSTDTVTPFKSTSSPFLSLCESDSETETEDSRASRLFLCRMTKKVSESAATEHPAFALEEQTWRLRLKRDVNKHGMRLR